MKLEGIMALKLKIYSKEDGFTADEIKRGIHWVYADITCPYCGKEQSVMMTQYLGGPCCRCGEKTGGNI